MKFFLWCKKNKKLLLVNAVCLVIYFMLGIWQSSITSNEYSQQLGQRWGDSQIKYHQVSMFASKEAVVGKDTISQARSTIQGKLMDASYTQDSVTGRLWIDSYYSHMQSTLYSLKTGGKEESCQADVWGVGADFFLFHPLKLMDGNQFKTEDVCKDRILLDRQTAWDLYGGYDLSGKIVEIGGRKFTIVGVYEPEENKELAKLTGELPCVFIHYDALVGLDENVTINGYEAVIPEPVSGFALNCMQSAFGDALTDIDLESTDVKSVQRIYIDNTTRFSDLELLKSLKHIKENIIRNDTVVYPYWENGQRLLGFKASLICLFKYVFLFPVILTIIIFLILKFIYIRKNDSVKKLFIKWKDKAERQMEIRREKKKAQKEKEELTQENNENEKTLVTVETDREASNEDRTVPDEDWTVPNEEQTVPNEDWTVPNEEQTVPNEEQTVPEVEQIVYEENEETSEAEQEIQKQLNLISEEILKIQDGDRDEI